MIMAGRYNPLIIETLQGLAGGGQMHRTYLNYLLIQALVLFFWWPKSSIFKLIENEDGPITLLAVVIALGVSVAYYSIRAGGEELLLPGQHSLRAWAVATPLGLGRILRGYISAHLLQTLHALLLSSPLLLMAYAVAGDGWPGLGWSLLTVLLQATFYRLLGALMYILIGHHEVLMFIALRAVLLSGYVLAGILFPLSSHLVVAARLLNGSPELSYLQDFSVIYGMLCLLSGAALYVLLARQRRLTDSPVTTTPASAMAAPARQPGEVRNR
jgi:hypothetical protein